MYYLKLRLFRNVKQIYPKCTFYKHTSKTSLLVRLGENIAQMVPFDEFERCSSLSHSLRTVFGVNRQSLAKKKIFFLSDSWKKRKDFITRTGITLIAVVTWDNSSISVCCKSKT